MTSRARPTTRGYTVVELLVVVAIVGVLAAIGVVSYGAFARSAHAGEPYTVLPAIALGEDAHKMSTLTYVSCSSDPTDYYPHATPDEKKWHWVQPGHADAACWKTLGVATDGPVRFVYSVVAGGPGETPPAIPSFGAVLGAQSDPWFVIHAAGDLDGDGVRSSFWSSSIDPTVRCMNCDE
jgi:type IV pilus assembly protein PilA